MSQQEIQLAEAIRHLRSEWAAAMREGADQDLQFQLGPVELALPVTRGAGADAAVRLWVLSVSAKARYPDPPGHLPGGTY